MTEKAVTIRTPNTEHRTPNTEHRTPNTEHRTPNTEHRTPNTEHRTPNTEHRTPNHNNALVSIIIPACNTAPYIHRAIESSLRQTYTNIEILIIDDGSTDDTLTVARSYEPQDSRIRVFTQPNKGVSAARNYGIREAKGEYLTFLDSDDWFTDDAVAILVDEQLKHPDKLISGNYYSLRIEDGKMFRRLCNDESVHDCSLTVEEVAQCMCGSFPLSFNVPWGKLFKAEYGLTFVEGITYCEDQVFVLDYASRIGGAYYTSSVIINVLVRQGSITHPRSYNPELQRSRAVVSKILTGNPRLSPEAREIMMIQSLKFANISATLTPPEGITKQDIRAIREDAKLYAPAYLKSRKTILKGKIMLLYQLYLPLPISRLLFHTYTRLKKCVRFMLGLHDPVLHEEEIPCW